MKIWLPAIRAGSGVDVFTLRIAEGLRRAGHEPVLQWFAHRYELMPWALKNFPAPARTDVIHAGSWLGFAFKRVGIPLVVTEHHYIRNPEFTPYRSNVQSLYHRLLVRRWLSRSFDSADCIVAVSQNTAKAIMRDVDKPVRVIPNWVDTDQFSPRERPVQHRTAGKFRVLFVGNPSRWKGADLLPRYAELLTDEIELYCLGGLRRDVSTARMPKNMRLVPRTSPGGMADLYRDMDAVVVPARYEAFGYVALEAMSCGLPVIGFATTGTAEVCVQGETAMLAPIDDLGQLVDYTRQLIASPELRVRLGSAGRARAVEHFGETASIKQYIDVYERLLDQGQQARGRVNR